MADIVTPGSQTVEANDNVLFLLNRVWSKCSRIRHEATSGRIVLLPGLYRVGFNANLSSAAAGEAILELTQDGEGVPGAKIQTTLAAGDFANGAMTVEIRVCEPCCSSVGVKNIGTVAITVSDANLVVSRIG